MKKRGNGTIEHDTSLRYGGSAESLSVTDSCRDGAVITQHDVSDRDSLANIAHSQRFKSAVRHVWAGRPRYKLPASRASKIK
jgi:hypothetical protein